MLAQVFTDIISKVRRHKQLEALIVHRLENKSHMKEIIDFSPTHFIIKATIKVIIFGKH